MSLLKSLQNDLTCTTVPWFPRGDARFRFLINEIVVGEESDVDDNGEHTSHFELYLAAMDQCGACTEMIRRFCSEVYGGSDLISAHIVASTPHEVRQFVNFTFEVIEKEEPYLKAAVLTFGREDLIPDMFNEIVKNHVSKSPDLFSTFSYYLERHIEVDGGQHRNLAIEMVTRLCSDDECKWKAVEELTVKALEMRIALWDGVLREILHRRRLNATREDQACIHRDSDHSDGPI